MDLRQPGEAKEPVQDAHATTLEPAAAHTRGRESIFGTVEVTRTGYRGEGTLSLHRLDGALNLPPEKYSLEVRRRVAIEASESAFDEGVKTLEAFTGAHVTGPTGHELAGSSHAGCRSRACSILTPMCGLPPTIHDKNRMR